MTTTAESIGIRTTGLRHARLGTTDLARARVFYLVRLGFPVLLDEDAQFVFRAGDSTIAVHAHPDDGVPDDAGGPERAGLRAIALGCADGAELRRVASALTGAGIAHSGVKHDAARRAEYLAFRDPDGIEWELCTIA